MKRVNVNLQVAEILRQRGWMVFDARSDSANGVDLTIARGNKSYRVEVKTAIQSTRCWKVNKVSRPEACDALAILLPDGGVLLQPMSEHIKLISRSGVRCVTDLVELNRLETGDTL